MSAEGAAVARAPAPAGETPARGRLRLDGFELGVLAALALCAVAAVAGLLVRVWTKGGVLTGGEGYVVIDQLQYLAWIRDAGDHVAVGNPFDLASGPRSLVHPGVIVSGFLHRLGLGLIAAYAVWKPIAVLALFSGSLLYVRRFVARKGDGRLALVLALFTASPVAALVGWLLIGGQFRKFQFDFLSGEMWPVNYLWGYPFTAIAVGLMPLGLLAYERSRGAGIGRMRWAAAGVGLVCSWLQPWQGATFAMVIVGAELIGRWRDGRPLTPAAHDLAVPLAATAAPLVYYFVLGRLDSSWELADRANDLPRWPIWVTLIGIAPLAVPAALSYTRAPRDFGELALRLWPIAALLVFYEPVATFPFHAFQGLTLPLVVLAVCGVRERLGARSVAPVVAIGLAAVLVVPGTIYRVRDLRGAVNKSFQPFFLTPDENDAMSYLERRPESGGVLAPLYVAQAVPARTGRETWVGAISWTPDYATRRTLADRLFAGDMGAARARALVRESGARFLLSDCQDRADISRLVAGVAGPPVRFGCATVYRVRPAGAAK